MRERTYLIYSLEHHAWWRPNELGYTPKRNQAGEYTLDRAVEICRDANMQSGNVPNETMCPSDYRED